MAAAATTDTKESDNSDSIPNPNIYQFKITLKRTKPKIWRRIQVPDRYNFWDLHVAIQDAMGWHNCHLHQFNMKEPSTGRNILIGSTPDDEESFGFADTIPEKTANITEYFLSSKNKASYLYDFGDGWEHEVMLEKILPAVAGTQYPQCIGGKMACPPEDCGGVYGYENLLKIMANPKHEEYEDRLEWLEGNFDPIKFDPKSVMFNNPEAPCCLM